MARTPAAHGRDEVVEALIRSATELLSERGINEVSVRDIARHAGVNHGLVHRHFGSKMGLIKAVYDRLLDDLRAAATEFPEGSGLFPYLFQASRKQRHLQRIRMYALLEGYSLREIQSEFPIADRMLASFRRAEATGRLASGLSPELATAAMLAASMGWLMFEPFLIEAAGLDAQSPDVLADEFNALLKRLTQSVLLPEAGQSGGRKGYAAQAAD